MDAGDDWKAAPANAVVVRWDVVLDDLQVNLSELIAKGKVLWLDVDAGEKLVRPDVEWLNGVFELDSTDG